MTVDYADLAIIDISKAETEQGRAALAVEVRDALLKHGFFYVVNHGYSEAEVRRSRPIKVIISLSIVSRCRRLAFLTSRTYPSQLSVMTRSKRMLER